MPKNRKITIQQLGEGQDEAGQPVTDWADVCTVWADIRDVSGREYVAANADRAEVTTRIRIWRRPGIKAAMRVVHGSTVYDIKFPLDEGRDTTLLMCTKVTT
jgi:SPP1 family predicted phage head-tail adaptor